MERKLGMGNARTNEAEMQAYRDRLRDLIDADKKRSDSRKVDRQPFVDAWVGLVKETGITDEAVDFFYDGIRMAESEPLYKYASESDVAKAYQDFLKARRSVSNERGCTMRVLLSLLALELIEPNEPSPLDFIARRLPSLVTGKRGKQLEQTVRRTMVRPLANDPISADADMQSASAYNLLKLLRPLLQSIIGGRNSHKADPVAARNLLGWLEEHANPASDCEPDSDEQRNVPASDVTTGPKDEPGQQDAQPTPDAVSDHDAADETNPMAPHETDDNQTCTPSKTGRSSQEGAEESRESNGDQAQPKSRKKDKSATKVPRGKADDPTPSKPEEIEELKAKLEKALSAKRAAEEQADRFESLLKTARREVDELREQRKSLSGYYADLQARLDSARTENLEIKANLAVAEEMLTMLEERNAHAADVADQKMVDELRFEYEQYQDAIDLPMSDDLGEIMRDNLGKVFEILKENGIDL